MATPSGNPPDAPGGRIPGPLFLFLLLAALALFITGLVVTGDWVRRPQPAEPTPVSPSTGLDDPTLPAPAEGPVEEERDRMKAEQDQPRTELESTPEPK